MMENEESLVPAGDMVPPPFEVPEEVRKFLRPEDWHRLAASWAEAEAQAMAMADSEYESAYGNQMLPNGTSSTFLPRLSSSSFNQTRRREKRSTPKWDDRFATKLGVDSRMPPPLRRYFDHLPSEASAPRQHMRTEVRKLFGPKADVPDIWSFQHPNFPPHLSEATARRLERSSGSCPEIIREEREKKWINNWALTATVDNDMLNPLLRHYFDRRGLESSYRLRPQLDAVTPKIRPRTPGRPSTRDKLLRHTRSDTSLGDTRRSKASDEPEVSASTRGEGDIVWGRRCLTYGPDESKKARPGEPKIPWVRDHHRVESEDNHLVNPLNRHYFDQDGLESSFRQRGRQYGRPLRGVMGLPPLHAPGLQNPKEADEAAEAAEAVDLQMKLEGLGGGLQNMLQSWGAEVDTELLRWTFNAWNEHIQATQAAALKEAMKNEEMEALMRKAARMFAPETDETIMRHSLQAWHAYTQNEAVEKMKRRMEEMSQNAALEEAMKKAALLFGPQTDEAKRKVFFSEWRDLVSKEKVAAMQRKMEAMARDSRVDSLMQRAKILFAPPTDAAICLTNFQAWAAVVAEEKVEKMKRQMEEMAQDAKLQAALKQASAIFGTMMGDALKPLLFNTWREYIAEEKMHAMKRKLQEKLSGGMMEKIKEATAGMVKTCFQTWQQQAVQAQVDAMKAKMEREERKAQLIRRAAEAFGFVSPEETKGVLFQTWATYVKDLKMQEMKALLEQLEKSKRLEDIFKQAAALFGDFTDEGIIKEILLAWHTETKDAQLERLRARAKEREKEDMLEKAKASLGVRADATLMKQACHAWKLAVVETRHKEAEAELAKKLRESEEKQRQAEVERQEMLRRAAEREEELKAERLKAEQSKQCSVM